MEFLIDYQEKWPNFLQIVFEEIWNTVAFKFEKIWNFINGLLILNRTSSRFVAAFLARYNLLQFSPVTDKPRFPTRRIMGQVKTTQYIINSVHMILFSKKSLLCERVLHRADWRKKSLLNQHHFQNLHFQKEAFPEEFSNSLRTQYKKISKARIFTPPKHRQT